MPSLSLGLGLPTRGRGVGVAAIAWFVSSITGDDTNDGRSPTSPLATFGALTSQPDLAGGQTINLERESVWPEFLDLSLLSGMTVEAYGSGSKPLITALEPVSTFALTTGQTNTYQFNHTAAHGGGDATVHPLAIFEDGKILASRTSIALVEANPGSYYAVSGASAGMPVTIYLHPKGGTNPNTDGKVYEITEREKVIQCDDNATIKNLRFIVGAWKDGIVLKDGTTFANNDVEGGVIHSIVAEATVLDGISVTNTSPNTSGAVTFYKGTPDPSDEFVIRNSFVLPGSGGLPWLSVGPKGLYSHSSLGQQLPLVRLENNVIHRGITLDNGKDVVITDNQLLTASSNSISVTGQATVEGNRIEITVNDGGSIRSTIFKGSGTHTVKGNRFYAGDGSSSGLVRAFYTVETPTLILENNSVFYDPLLSGNNLIGTGTATWSLIINRNAVAGVFRIIQDAAADFTYEGDNNIFYRNASLVPNWTVSGVANYTLAQWQSLRAEELNSIIIDPAFTDPANGDFTTTGAGATAAAARQAGVEYYVPG